MSCRVFAVCFLACICALAASCGADVNEKGWEEVGEYEPWERPDDLEPIADGGVYIEGEGFRSPYKFDAPYEVEAAVGKPFEQEYPVVHRTTGDRPRYLPVVWGISKGELPPGLKLYVNEDGTRGVLEGTPLKPGTYQFSVSVRTTPKDEKSYPGRGGGRIVVTVK